MTARLAGNEVNSPLETSCCEDRGRPSGAPLAAALDGLDREFSPDESTSANAQK